jgi:hypothetical protein
MIRLKGVAHSEQNSENQNASHDPHLIMASRVICATAKTLAFAGLIVTENR